MYRDAFAALAGGELPELLRVDPAYRVFFDGDGSLDLLYDEAAMAAQLERVGGRGEVRAKIIFCRGQDHLPPRPGASGYLGRADRLGAAAGPFGRVAGTSSAASPAAISLTDPCESPRRTETNFFWLLWALVPVLGSRCMTYPKKFTNPPK